MTYDPKKNNVIRIFITALTLGAVVGISTVLWFCINEKWDGILVHLIILSVYYFLEFDSTARFQTNSLTENSFLLWGNVGNREFIYFQLLTMIEWSLQLHRWDIPYNFFKAIHRFIYCKRTKIFGLCLSLTGLLLRRLAMWNCGDSFSHIIETRNRKQKLITTGIYAYIRHPSYLGFWMFSIGLQVYLENFVCLIGCIVVLNIFFKQRIQFEEWYLVHKIFGDLYIEYRARVHHWIPFLFIENQT